MASLKGKEMIEYTVWGSDNIDQPTREQMEAACRLPITRKAALMPDAHLGYGLPIGGVLATEGAVIPYGVGMDIACRMRLTVTDGPVSLLEKNDPTECRELENSIRIQTRFGVGAHFESRRQHEVMDDPRWQETELLRSLKDLAWSQLGSSGGGNHFVEWGVLYGSNHTNVALMSHSGSRGPGARICRHYTSVAREQNPANELSWLNLDTEAGQEYWVSMQLMGDYAAANHQLIHKHVLRGAGLQSLVVVENHHNFAWEEDGLIVHRKGATPAHKGVLGVIPGSMATPAYVVVGAGNADSINSASHGAGRRMSRNEAKRKFTVAMWKPFLKEGNVRVIGDVRRDELPGSYKPIEEVMQAQEDLVTPIEEFHPRIVKMA
jgi:tRNA-splicing ligase RtcB